MILLRQILSVLLVAVLVPTHSPWALSLVDFAEDHMHHASVEWSEGHMHVVFHHDESTAVPGHTQPEIDPSYSVRQRHHRGTIVLPSITSAADHHSDHVIHALLPGHVLRATATTAPLAAALIASAHLLLPAQKPLSNERWRPNAAPPPVGTLDLLRTTVLLV